MDIYEAIKERHSVRNYDSRPIESEKAEKLQEIIDSCNRIGKLHIQLVLDEPEAFSSRLARYGSFSGVANYIVMAGRKRDDLDERVGYYGEKIVLEAQMMGLNTCWVGLTYKKVPDAFRLFYGEKVVAVIAIGYGTMKGYPHKSKKMADVAKCDGPMPEWFVHGVEAALMAPTAVNQQKFTLTLRSDGVEAKAGMGFYAKVDLGIIKCHFEIGSGRNSSVWI